MVLMHTTTWPGAALRTMPRSPAMTSSAWAVVSTITMVRPVATATSSAEAATVAPRSRSGSTLARIHVVDDEGETVLDEVQRHRPAHIAEPDESHGESHGRPPR